MPVSQSSKGHSALSSFEIVFKWDRMVLTLSKLVSFNIVFPGFLYIHILKLGYENFIIYAIHIDMFRYDTHTYTQAFNVTAHTFHSITGLSKNTRAPPTSEH